MNKFEELAQQYNHVKPISFGDIPDGDYNARIDSMILGEAKSDGHAQVDITLTIVEGEYEGRKKFDHAGVDSEQRIAYFKGTLLSLGVDELSVNNIAVWGDVFEALSGCGVHITLKTGKSEYQNVRYNNLIDISGSAEEAPKQEAPKRRGRGPAKGGVSAPAPKVGAPKPATGAKELAVGAAEVIAEDGNWYPCEILSIKGEKAIIEMEGQDPIKVDVTDLRAV